MAAFSCSLRFSFDSSVAGIFGSLTNGGTLIIATRDTARDPSRLNDFIVLHRVETFLCIPGLYSQMLEHSTCVARLERSLSKLIVAGEACLRI
jgi:non-ribosomal peptide synthetase component F